MNSPLLGATIVDSLVQLGTRHVVLAPGSRNAALSLALFEADQADALRLHVRVDERVAAYTALGLAKATGQVVAVVTTSGTATANLAPAAMEARNAGIPLLFITADRPAETVGTGISQTGHQLGILGPSALEVVRVASAAGRPNRWSAAVARAHTAAAGHRTRRPGPVQLNAEFALPVVGPVPDTEVLLPQIRPTRPAEDVLRLPAGPRTVVIVGDATPELGERARACAELAGLPLLAEPSSNARAGHCAIPDYRQLLNSELGDQIERVIVFGHPTLSRPVTRLLGRPDIELIVVSGNAEWHDIGGRARAVVDAVRVAPSDPAWLTAWQEAAHTAPSGWDGPTVAATVLAACGPDDVLVYGSSKPIRDADVAPIADHPPRTYANRGLAGIDGVIATASGIGLGLQRRVTVLLGDLTFQHDLGALALPEQEPQPDLRIVVADDNGGAIFHTLEQGAPEYAAAFERVFATPQHLDLVAVARAMGWEAVRVTSQGELAEALALPGRRIIVAQLGRQAAGC